MSMELCVFSEAKLDSISNWQQAIDAEGFALQLSADGPFAQVNGFLPARLGYKRTGFECYHVDPRVIIETYGNIHFGTEWKYALSLIWGGDFTEMRAAWVGAASYARATSGLVFDPQAGQLFTAPEGVAIAKDNEHVLAQLEAGTANMEDSQ